MQNEPNLKNEQINTKAYKTITYEKLQPFNNPKNEANVNIGKIDVTFCLRKNYENNYAERPKKTKPKQTQFKPNFKNGKNERKLKFNKGLQK